MNYENMEYDINYCKHQMCITAGTLLIIYIAVNMYKAIRCNMLFKEKERVQTWMLIEDGW